MDFSLLCESPVQMAFLISNEPQPQGGIPMDNKTASRPKTIFERMGVTYTEGADGLLYPDIVLSEDKPHYGKYGRMRKAFLKEHRPATYSCLILQCRLVAHLNEIDDAANEQMENMMDAMAKAEGVTEALKAADQMEWVCRMNSIHNRAEEIVTQTLIYGD